MDRLTRNIVVALLLPITVWVSIHIAEPVFRPRGRSVDCFGNVSRLSLALLQYHSDYGALPPVVFRDEASGNMHSLRVLLLPYLDQSVAYSLYRFDEPWNSPHNSQFKTAGILYRCPSRDPDEGEWNTSYVACAGAGTVWPDIRNRDAPVSDDPAALMLIEVRATGIHWMCPHEMELDLEELLKHCRVWGNHYAGNFGALRDSRVHLIPRQTPVRALKSARG